MAESKNQSQSELLAVALDLLKSTNEKKSGSSLDRVISILAGLASLISILALVINWGAIPEKLQNNVDKLTKVEQVIQEINIKQAEVTGRLNNIDYRLNNPK